jgi:alkanesulfonate monooxygenase SsuD/methylene tetrahydromethanopterin reductase-like flavin-dependent oxidoreductase (luciferase family)
MPTLRHFINITRCRTMHDHPRFVGSPKDVADGMEEWFSRGMRGVRVV